jgi:hypothetical protein
MAPRLRNGDISAPGVQDGWQATVCHRRDATATYASSVVRSAIRGTPADHATPAGAQGPGEHRTRYDDVPCSRDGNQRRRRYRGAGRGPGQPRRPRLARSRTLAELAASDNPDYGNAGLSAGAVTALVADHRARTRDVPWPAARGVSPDRQAFPAVRSPVPRDAARAAGCGAGGVVCRPRHRLCPGVGRAAGTARPLTW